MESDHLAVRARQHRRRCPHAGKLYSACLLLRGAALLHVLGVVAAVEADVEAIVSARV